MKIKKIYSEKGYKNCEIDLKSDKVTIEMNGEEFVKLMTALEIAKLSKVAYSEEICNKLINCRHETEWTE